MRPLSAAEAIQPAINRTRAVLFQPFRPGRSFKLAIVAYLSSMGSMFLPTPFFGLGHLHSGLLGILFYLWITAVYMAVLFVFFYFGARLEFILFDIVLLNEKFIAPSWRRHRHHSWRWIGCKLLFSAVAGILCGPIFYVCAVHLMPRLQADAAPGQPPSPELLRTLLSFYALFGLPIIFVVLCSSLLTNFVLPSIALENTTVREGLRRFFNLVSAEPGPVSLFVVLKIGLGIAGFMAVEMVIIFAELLCLIPIGLIAVAGYFLLRSAGGAGHIAMLGGAGVLFLLFIACLFYGITLLMGALHVFFQAYALYFLGGRYPALGDLLEPPFYAPPPIALTQAPPPPVPEEPA